MTIKTTTISFEEFSGLYFKPPATFYIKNALGEYVYIHTRDRNVAQATVDDLYGENKYKVTTAGQTKSTKGLTCTGTQTRKRSSK